MCVFKAELGKKGLTVFMHDRVTVGRVAEFLSPSHAVHIAQPEIHSNTLRCSSANLPFGYVSEMG